jgi:hypothetical protein
MTKKISLKRIVENVVNEEFSILLTEAEPSSDLDGLDSLIDDGGGEGGDKKEKDDDTSEEDKVGSDESGKESDAENGGNDKGEGLDLGSGGPSDGGEKDDTGDDKDSSEAEPLGGGSSSGGGFSFGGGGLGGGGGSDKKDKAPKEKDSSDDAKKSSKKPEDIALPTDPIQSTVDMASGMLDTTNDDQVVLNAVKASIQRNFGNVEDAAPIIQYLWDTENPILKTVARKLLLFIRER